MFYSFSRFRFGFSLALIARIPLFFLRALCLLQIFHTNLVSFRLPCLCVYLQCLSSLIAFFPRTDSGMWHRVYLNEPSVSRKSQQYYLVPIDSFFPFIHSFIYSIHSLWIYSSFIHLQWPGEIKCVRIHFGRCLNFAISTFWAGSNGH